MPSLGSGDLVRLLERAIQELVNRQICTSENADSLRRVVISRESTSETRKRVVKSIRQNHETIS